MLFERTNGYVLEVNRITNGGDTLLVTLTDGVGKEFLFSVAKIGGKWRIRNPLTVPAFVITLESELLRGIEEGILDGLEKSHDRYNPRRYI